MAENVPESRPESMPEESGAEPSPAAAGAAVPKARTPETGGVSPRKRAQKASAKASKPAKATKAAKATKPAKATEVTKPAKATKATKASQATDAPARSTAEPAPQLVPAVPGAWSRAAWEAVREPEQPPQRLAELAVAELGPRAAAWAQWLRQTYPAAPADGLARLATRQAVRQVRAVALAGIGGPATIPFTMSSDAWVRATVVLRIAAAYGRDPADPARVSELLELTGLTAEPAGDPSRPTGTGSRTGAYLRRLSKFRLASVAVSPRRPLSILGLLAGVAESGYGVERLAHRAARFYRPGSQSSTSASVRSSSSAKIP